MALRHSRLILPLIVLAACSLAVGRSSDPVRNLHPEEPSAPTEVLHPIYYVLPMAHAAEPGGVSPEALLQEFLDKHTAMNYPGAAEAALRLINCAPDRPAGHYNLACAMARMQRIDEAFDALRQAVQRGWRDVLHMSIDPDLAPLRGDERFAAIVAHVQELIDAERIVPVPLREDHWSAVAADLSRAIPPLLKRYHVPGAAVALIDRGEVVWTSAFGIRDARSEDALGVDDRFRLRAPLHVLTIAACGQLERDNKMQLATLIQEAANQYAMVTALPQQRSDNDDDQPLVRPANIRQSAQRSRDDDGMPGESPLPVDDAPPRLRSYSRASVYGLLRLAVEAASGENFPQYCDRTILQPLNLKHTTFVVKEGGEAAVAVGHSDFGTPLRPSVMAGEFAPGGAIHTTAGDLARLIANSMAVAPAAHRKSELASARMQNVFMDDAEAGAEPDGRGGGRCEGGAWELGQRSNLASALDMVTRADCAMRGGLGLALQRREQADGTVDMELGESASGIVCLARWHPQTRRGIVILANSATARHAAERIAHIALGGQ